METNTPQKKIWFRAKRYGYGWYPSSWEGWLTLVLFLAVTCVNTIRILPATQPDAVPFFTIQFIALVILFVICFKKGEKARWRWGKDDEK